MDRRSIAYNENSLFINASARLPSSSPSSVIYSIISVGFVIDEKTGVILDCTITLLSEGAVEFLKYLIIGENLHKNGVKKMINRIKDRYKGESQNAICVAIERLYVKYMRHRRELQ